MRRWLPLLLIMAAFGAEAQTVRLPAQVTGVAGSEAYLDRGTADGLAVGDTVAVERDGGLIGELAVVAASADRAVATFAGAPFALTRGEQIVLVRSERNAARPPEPPSPPPDTVRSSRASLFEQPPPPARSPGRASLRLAGRLQTGFQALRSSTQPDDGASVDRMFATPFVSLRADVAGLPAGAKLHLDARSTYRYTDAPGATSLGDIRVYNAAVELSSRRVHVEAGRFLSDYERTSGYWDGIGLRIGSERAGVGTTVGFQPERTNGVPALDLPKVASYLYTSHREGPTRAEATVSGGHLFSDRGTSFGGATGSAVYRSGGTALRASAALLGETTGNDGWHLARASVRGGARVSGLDVSAAYGRYRPSDLTAARLPVGLSFAPIVRETLTGRVGLQLGARGPEVHASGGAYRRDGAADGHSVGAGVRLSRLPAPVPLGLSLDLTSRERNGIGSLYASARATATVGTTSLALGYRLSRLGLLDQTRTTHGLEGSLSASLSRRIGVSVFVGQYGGGGLGRSSVYSSVWMRL